ncbi:MAG: DUF2231 domain-containing protein [Actinobacteria bacterium]|nr:DUF2231 domain-containing protein [Actinomycetota bacterium]
MRLLKIALHGFRGHPLHPPLTDVSIGAYTVATIAVVLGWAGWKEELMAGAGFVAVIVGLGAALPTAVTGLADFLKIPNDSGARRTGWLHLAIMVTATLLFALAAILLYPGYLDEGVPPGAAIATIIAFVVLTAGGWVGGSLAYVHGVRVLGREDASLTEALTPSLPELDAPTGRRR